MIERVATCRCGQLHVKCTGDPVRVSVCHCFECQKRSGSAFAAQARWPSDQVEMTGAFSVWTRTGDSGHLATHRFCAKCGCTVAFTSDGTPDVTAIPIGAFADSDFPTPQFSVYENRKHSWVAILGDDIERHR